MEELQGKHGEVGAPSVSLDLPLDAYLPDEYVGIVPEGEVLSTPGEPGPLRAGRSDGGRVERSFGPPPQPVKNLLAMVRLKVEAALSGYEAISAKDYEFVLTVRRTIVPNRIVLYRRFKNEARVQQGVIHIPRRLLGQTGWSNYGSYCLRSRRLHREAMNCVSTQPRYQITISPCACNSPRIRSIS